MLTTGAADGNRQVAAVLLFKLGYPVVQKAANILEHIIDIVTFLEKIDNFTIKAGQGSEFGFPVWIRQAANIKYKIGISRCAMFKTK